MKKFKIFFTLLIALACLVSISVMAISAEETGEAEKTITVSFMNTSDTLSTSTALDTTAHADGKITVKAGETITLPTTSSDTNTGADGFHLIWYTQEGRAYKAGEQVVFTEDTKLFRCAAKEFVYDPNNSNSQAKQFSSLINTSPHAVILTHDVEFKEYVSIKGEASNIIFLNGYDITFNGNINGLGQQRTGRYIYGEGTIKFVNDTKAAGTYYVFNMKSHSHNGDRNKTVVGVDVTIDAPNHRLFDDSEGSMRKSGYPYVKIYGDVNVYHLGNVNSYNSNPRIEIMDGATVKISANRFVIDNTTNAQSFKVTITGGTFVLPESAKSIHFWTSDYKDKDTSGTYTKESLTMENYDVFTVTGGSYSVKLPDGILKNGYECVYNNETGYYDVVYVGCTVENSNGVHNYVKAEVYEDTASTCTTAGAYYFRCDCGSYYVDAVDALGHDYSVLASETPATCFAKAYKTYKCVRCDSTSNVEYGSALGHDYSIVKVTKLATAIENGKKLFICSRCDCYENGTHTDYDEANPSTTCSHGCYYEDYSFSSSDILIELVVKDGDTNKTVIVKVSDVYTITDGVFGAIKTFADPSDPSKTYNASSIVKLVIPAGVTSIPAGAIKSMSALEEIYFSEGANATLAQKSIDSCANLIKIVAENCTLVFEQYTVNNCANLATIDVSKSNATFKSNAFKGFTAVKHLLLGSGQTYNFGTFAFASSGLKEVILPDDSMVTLSQKSFAETTTIEYVYIGKNCISTKTSDGKIALGDDGNNGAYSIFGGNAVLSKVVMMDIEYVAKWVFSVKTSGSYVAKNDIYIYCHADLIEFNTSTVNGSSQSTFNDRNAYNVYIYANEVVKTPTNCKYVVYNGIPHKYIEGGSEPTCTAQGSTAYTTDCPCGVVADATYTVSAYSGYTGDTTGGTITVGEVTPAKGHEFDPEKGATVVETTPSTCLKGGTITYKCARCDETITVDNPDDPQKEHNVEGVEFEVTLPVTCTTDGLQVKLCKDCKLLAQSEVIPATGHDIEGVEWTQATAPSCTLAGTNVKLCKTCGEVAETQSADALGHNPGELIQTLAPDCDEDGLKEKHCTACDALIATEIVEKLGHEFDVSDGAVLFGMEYPNGFDKAGAILTKCARCAITSNTEVAPIFAAKGYSTNSAKTSLDGGYVVDTELLALYESYNGAITYGVVIANANLFNGNSFFNGENKVSITQAMQVQIKDKSYTNFSCSITNFGTHSSTLELVICAYVIDENGNVSFIQAENDYAIATTIGGQSFTKVTLDLVVANVTEQPDALVPSSDEE